MGQVNKPMNQQGNNYEVFLSYSRGKGTQKSFSCCLYSSLREAGISVLKDRISIGLLQSIVEGSEISIIIFSKHYASSRRCLEELTKIMEFHKSHDLVVLPIFYRVDQSDVCNQESTFGPAFRNLVQRISPTKDEVSRWMTALSEAGGNCGFFVPNFKSKTESEVIQNILGHVRQILNRKGLFTKDGLVGVRSQAQEVIKMLRKHESKDFVSIGIWGMGGIGKTTIARLIFDSIQHEFESTCFLSNVAAACERGDIIGLQDEIFSTRCDKRVDIHKKVLVVLDDVNDLKQLHDLYGVLYGQWRRVIITTRDLHLLKALKVDDVYSVKLLSNHDSLQLFSRKTLKPAIPDGEFIELNKRMVAYAEGLPLALEVFGSFLAGKPLMGWEAALMKLSTDLPLDMYNTLKRSFDTLDDSKKEIFLNIVSFHIREDMNQVIQRLDGHGCNASIGIRALVDRSLVTIDENNKIRMHNVLQFMGRQIIRETSQNELPNQGYRYEVFLSFRGEDTRATFTSHLYLALCNASIVVFKDDVELPRGNYIKTELLQAIGSSKIAIVIFSREYAGSSWCLEELSIIMALHKSNDQVVLPVFYDVGPSEIRHQTSSFGEAFKDLIERISPPEYQASNWRAALAEAGGIAGIVVLGSSFDIYL